MRGRKPGGNRAETRRATQGKPGENLAETWRKPGGYLARFHRNRAVPMDRGVESKLPDRTRFQVIGHQMIAMAPSNQGELAVADGRWDCAIGSTLKVTAAYNAFLTIVTQIVTHVHVTRNLSAGAMR